MPLNELKPPRLIALDLDGTLLRSDKTISQTNRDAVNRAIEAGIKVVLASGRMHSATLQYAKQMSFDDSSYIISYNGALARTIGGEKLVDEPLTADPAEEIIRFATDGGLHLNVYLEDVLYNAVHDKWTDIYRQRTGSVAQIVGDLTQFIGRRPTKLLIINEPAKIDKLLAQMQERYTGRLHVLKTDDEYLEFMSLSANKGRALAAVASKLDVPREQCIALGDNYNDLPMLEWAGRGIVMANGRPELLKQIGDHAPAADEDGVAQIINGLLGTKGASRTIN